MSKTSAALANPSKSTSRTRRNGRDERLSMLTDCANHVGEAWADRARTALRQQGRSASGGWPGTMSEARLEVMESVLPEVRRQGLDPATMSEREEVARALYASARHSWLAYREPEEN